MCENVELLLFLNLIETFTKNHAFIGQKVNSNAPLVTRARTTLLYIYMSRPTDRPTYLPRYLIHYITVQYHTLPYLTLQYNTLQYTHIYPHALQTN